MTIRIKGVATVPNIYKSEGGEDVALRLEDLRAISESYVTNSCPIVVNHDDQSFSYNKGMVLELDVNDEDKFTYDAYVTDPVLERQIKDIYESGEIPNVSPQFVPKCDSIHKITLDDGSDVYYADKWEFEHLSIVNKGRCDDTMGCGVHEVEDVELGEIVMTEEIEALKLELETLKAQQVTSAEEIEKLNLELKEVTTERDSFVQKEVDEMKALILRHNKEAELDEINDIPSLKVILGQVEGIAAKGKAIAEGDDKSPTTLKLEQLKQKRMEQYMIR
jgi:hypothetical protein